MLMFPSNDIRDFWSNIMKELNSNDLQQVNGGVLANIAGAIGGGIGGFYGAIIASPSATGFDIIKGTFAGALVGTLSPVNGIRSGVLAVGSGVVGGAAINLADDVANAF